MRRLTVSVMTSLDGVIQAPGGPDEDPTGGFRFGGWMYPFWDEVADEAIGGLFARPFSLLLGRKTYEIFAAYWPYQQGEIAGPFNAATKYVATSSADPLAWENSVKLVGDPVEAVARLKEGEGPDLLTQGSATFVRSLLVAGLADALVLIVCPVLLGRGKSWIGGDAKPGEWALTESRTSTTGVIISHYEPKGPIRTGSFAGGEPSAAELGRRAKMEAGTW